MHHTGLFTVGVFGLIFNEEGKLLLKRRPQGIPEAGNWDLPGGGISSEFPANPPRFGEDYLTSECIREIKEETGLDCFSSYDRSNDVRCYIALRENSQNPRHLGDIAFTILMDRDDANQEPTGEFGWFSPTELHELAEREDGNRLVSGFGARHWRMCVEGFRDHSPNRKYRDRAALMLIG